MTTQETELLNNLKSELVEIKQLLVKVIKDNGKPVMPVVDKEYLTPEECAAFIGTSKSYIYQLTSQNKVPRHKPGGNRVLIKKQDLIEWMESNRIKSDSEIGKEVSNRLLGYSRRQRAS